MAGRLRRLPRVAIAVVKVEQHYPGWDAFYSRPASRSTPAPARPACATGGGNLGRRSRARTSSTSSSVRLALFAIQSYVEFAVTTVIACKHACL
jgi:hypothetical protein